MSVAMSWPTRSARGAVQASAGPHGSPATDQAQPSALNAAAFALFCLFVFAIPWENALVLAGVGTIGRLLGLVAFPAGVLAVFASGRVRGFSTPMVLMVLFVAWGCLSYLWTADAEVTSTLVFSWAQNLGMVWLIWELAPSRERQLWLMRAYVLGTLVSAGDTVIRYLGGQEVYYQRYAGSGFDPNDLGVLLALSLPMSFYLASTEKRVVVAWIYRVQQVAAVVAVGLTSSRAALIAMIAALTYVPLAALKLSWREKCALLLLIFVAGGCLLAFLPESSWERWAGLGTELQQGNWGARTLIWSVGLEIFEANPLIGVGAGTFPIVAQQLAPPIGAHNTFLSILVENGLVGFGLFTMLLLSLAVPALRLPTLQRNLWLIVLAVWAAGAFTLTWENRKPTWFLLGLLTAWLAAQTKVAPAHGWKR
jgi:O-antigen ligase